MLSYIRPASWKVLDQPLCFEKVWKSQDSLRSFVAYDISQLYLYTGTAADWQGGCEPAVT